MDGEGNIKVMFIVEPFPIFQIPLHGALFWLSVKVDLTTLERIIASPFLTLPFLLLARGRWAAFLYFAIELGSFLQAGASSPGCIELTCNQGANFADLGAALWSLPIVIHFYKVVIGRNGSR